MFERLFKYPRALARHREGPLAEARERFLLHCANEGTATLLRIARELLVIATRIDASAETPITRQQIEVAAHRWARHQRRRGRQCAGVLRHDGARYQPRLHEMHCSPRPIATPPKAAGTMP